MALSSPTSDSGAVLRCLVRSIPRPVRVSAMASAPGPVCSSAPRIVASVKDNTDNVEFILTCVMFVTPNGPPDNGIGEGDVCEQIGESY